MVPPCFSDAQQYRDWVALARMSKLEDVESGYCCDCTPKYKALMMSQRRCTYPMVRWRRSGEGISGYRPRGPATAAQVEEKMLPVTTWLEGFLADGEKRTADVMAAAVQVGISRERVRLACKILGLRVWKIGANGVWWLSLT